MKSISTKIVSADIKAVALSILSINLVNSKLIVYEVRDKNELTIDNDSIK